MRTSVKYTSLKFAPPEICLIGFTVYAGALHVEEEVREPFVLRHGRIGARHENAPVAVVRAGRPDLLAVHHPFVAALLRTRAQCREVRAAGRLAEELTPDLFAARELRQEALLLLFGRVRHQRRRRHALADLEDALRRFELALFLAPDHLLDRARAAAAEFLGPAQARPTRVELALLPQFRFADVVEPFEFGGASERSSSATRARLRGIVLQRRVVEIHGVVCSVLG